MQTPLSAIFLINGMPVFLAAAVFPDKAALSHPSSNNEGRGVYLLSDLKTEVL